MSTRSTGRLASRSCARTAIRRASVRDSRWTITAITLGDRRDNSSARFALLRYRNRPALLCYRNRAALLRYRNRAKRSQESSGCAAKADKWLKVTGRQTPREAEALASLLARA